MEKSKIIIFGITGHFATDQRMQRITAAALEKGHTPIVYYRNHLKYGNSAPKFQSFGFKTIGLTFKFNTGISFYFSYNLKLFFKLLFQPADKYYAVDADTLPAFTLLSFLKRVPLIYDAHEYFCEVPELKGHKMKKKIWDLVTRFGVKRSSQRITVGSRLAEELSARYGKPFLCLRNVPSNPQSLPNNHYPRPTIVYQGALNKGRELELLIDAMKVLTEMDCLIAGEGDLSEALRNRAKGMSNVKFLGLLSPQELKSMTPGCFAGFNLLNDEGSLSYHFSLSNKYFDYIHAGVPSISSFLPEYEELNKNDKCGICIENSLESLVKTMRNWMNQPEDYQKLKENTIIAKERYNWETEKMVLDEVF